MSDQLYQKLKDTATNHIKAFEDPDPFDPDQIYAFRDPACIMRFHASNSMPEPFGNDLHISRKEHEPALRMLGALMSRLRADIKLMVVDVQQRIVSTWLQLIFDFKATGGEPEEKNYMIEYVWITHHNETGDKIVWMEEFLDVPRALHMIGKAQVYAQENAK